MKFFFIVDYKKNSGLGHLKRSLLIAKRLENFNHKIFFLCNKNYFTEDKRNKFEFIKLNEKKLNKNVSLIKKKIISENPTLIIFDTYEISQKIINQISKLNKKIMIIHDFKFFKKNVDIYLNYNLKKIQKSKKILLGRKFAIVERKNILNRIYKDKIKRILLFFGGSDSKKLNLKFLKIFKSKTFHKYEFNFILSQNIKNQKKIQKYLNYKNFKKVKFDKNFQRNLHNTDLYIGAGGASLMDVIITGTPAIFFPINKNQKNNCSNIDKQKKLIVENVQKLEKTELMRKKLINYFNDYKSIIKVAKLNLNIFDGLGIQRVVNHILGNDKAKFKNKKF